MRGTGISIGGMAGLGKNLSEEVDGLSPGLDILVMVGVLLGVPLGVLVGVPVKINLTHMNNK
jgi:hypothetical protein